MKKLFFLLIAILAVALFSGQSLADVTKTENSAYTAEQLIGLNVDNLEGKHVGIIRDVNMNSATGEIDYVILGKSLLGIGEDKFEVPLEALKIHDDEISLNATLIVSEAKLLTAPSIAATATKTENVAYTAEQLIGLNVNNLEGKHIGIIRDVKLNSETDEIKFVILGKSLLGIGEDKFEVPLEALEIHNAQGRVSATLFIEEYKLISPPSIAANVTKTENVAYTPEQLFGLNVNNLEGKHIGIIRDVKLNFETGEINFVILGKSLFGIGVDKFAVPLEALKIHDDEISLNATLIVSEARLLNAPSIAAGESDEEFRVRLQNYYCQAPEFGEAIVGSEKC